MHLQYCPLLNQKQTIMQNSSFKINSLRLLFLLILLCNLSTCGKNENPENQECEDCDECEEIVARDIIIKEGVSTYDYGATAIINGEYWVANRVVFRAENDGEYWIQIRENVWLENTVWAFINQIRLQNIEVSRTDTIMLVHQSFGDVILPTAFFYTGVYDTYTECYELLMLDDFPSWVLITERDNDKGEITGIFQGAFIISNNCFIDPDDIEKLYITNCHFRAKLL